MMDDIEFTRIDKALVDLAGRVMERAQKRNLSLITAESCTGGLIAAVLSEAPGAADFLHGGFVTYTKQQKTIALGIDPALLAEADVVSEPVARAMAEGALRRSPAGVSVAVTGVAGPTRDQDGTPVGIVHFASARRDGPTAHVMHDFGDIGRGACRRRAISEALLLLDRVLGSP